MSPVEKTWFNQYSMNSLLCTGQVLEPEEQVWRSGIFRTCQKYLTSEKRLSTLKNLIYGSRCLSCAAFSAFWKSSFQALAAAGEVEVVRQLKKFYFKEIDGQWRSEWSGSLTRVAAGFWVRSQPQENWHKVRLRTTLRDLYLPAGTVVERIANLFDSRVSQKAVTSETFGDVPCGHWSRKCAKEAKFFLQHINKLCVRSGSAWACRVQCDEASLHKLKTPVTSELVAFLRTIYLSQDPAECLAAMQSLPGCSTRSSVEQLAISLQKFCLVLEDDEALPFWRTSDVKAECLAWSFSLPWMR